ncbi:MAG: DUF664 domain-containing protein [Chloroflexota bacterium]|nr:DUF664 domain-containing protein [Chloroflexota bacterium]
MSQIPPENHAKGWEADTRPLFPLVGDERDILTAFLDWHRQTFELKCSGVAPEQLSKMALPPSRLSLRGLVRHLAATERWWFRRQFGREEQKDGDVVDAYTWSSAARDPRSARWCPAMLGALTQTQPGQTWSLAWAAFVGQRSG